MALQQRHPDHFFARAQRLSSEAQFRLAKYASMYLAIVDRVRVLEHVSTRDARGIHFHVSA